MISLDNSAVFEHLTGIAKDEMGLNEEQIGRLDPAESIMDNLQLDSLRQVILVASIERDYGCQLDLEQLEQVDTLNDLVELIVVNSVDRESL